MKVSTDRRSVGIDQISHVTETGSIEPLDLGRQYSIATTTFVAKRCGEFKNFFADQDGDRLANELETTIAETLAKLPDRNWKQIAQSRWRGL
jgi:hypothetical protein